MPRAELGIDGLRRRDRDCSMQVEFEQLSMPGSRLRP